MSENKILGTINRYTNLDKLATIANEMVMKVRELNKEKDFDKNFESLNDQGKKEIVTLVQKVLDNPNITAQQLHQDWIDLKAYNGWIYAKTINREKKEHNCLIPFSELNFYNQLKDHIFIETIKMYIEYTKTQFLQGNLAIKEVNERLWNDIDRTRKEMRKWFSDS